MKRHGNLYPQIIEFTNLLEAARKAQKGKRDQANVLRFNYRLETELLRLQKELTDREYRPGPYKTFHIVEPKRRMISAAPYRDRVVHHALCNVIQPVFERTFISGSYANRSGYGTHRALRRFTAFARSSRYLLQCDIQRYFPNIDHDILKSFIRRKIKCKNTLWLCDLIIDCSNEQEAPALWFPGDDLVTLAQRRKGLPIGNLTSQFFANVYLNGLDHFVMEQLKVAKYLRYVDDFALFSDSRDELEDARVAIECYLAGVRLKIHPVKSQLFECRHGASFLGFRVLPKQVRVRNENLRRARRRFRKLREEYRAGRVPMACLGESLRAWAAHLDHGDTWRLRERLFTELALGYDPQRGRQD